MLPPPRASTPSASADTTVLIASQDRLSSEIYQDHLSLALLLGSVVVSAELACDVMAADASIGVLLIDVAEPEQGLELISAIKLRVPERHWLQSILISRQPQADSAVALANAELSAFLVSPVAADALVTAVAKARACARTEQLRSTYEHDIKNGLDQVSKLGENARGIGLKLRALTAELQQVGDCMPRFEAGEVASGPLRNSPRNLQVLSSMERIDELRCQLLPGIFQSDPAWNMLSELGKSWLLNKKISTTSLCIASRAPVTTALRKLEQLIEDGFALRVPDEGDGRRVHIRPTAKGKQTIMTVIGSRESQQH